jgi:hypothetical protein
VTSYEETHSDNKSEEYQRHSQSMFAALLLGLLAARRFIGRIVIVVVRVK